MTARGLQFMEELLGALTRGGPLTHTLDRYIDTFLRFVEAQRGFFVILTRLTGTFEFGSGAWRREASAIRQPIDAAILELFEGAIRRGELPQGSPRAYSDLVTGALNSYVARWIRDEGQPTELREDVEPLRQLIRRALGAER